MKKYRVSGSGIDENHHISWSGIDEVKVSAAVQLAIYGRSAGAAGALFSHTPGEGTGEDGRGARVSK